MTAAYRVWLGVRNPTIVGLSYLLIVLPRRRRVDAPGGGFTSVGAALAFNFFFLPPVGTFTIADPQNWVALFVFLAVASSRAACP